MHDNNDLVSSDALPLPLTRLISDQPPADQLPLALNRLLGTIGDDTGGGTGPVDPTDPDLPRRMDGVVNCFDSSITTALSINDCLTARNAPHLIASPLVANRLPVLSVAQSYQMRIRAFVALSQCSTLTFDYVRLLSNCVFNNYLNFTLLSRCVSPTLSDGIGYEHCGSVISADVVSYQHCSTLPLTPTVQHVQCYAASNKGAFVSKCKTHKISAAIDVPCRYYPIPEPPVIPDASICSPRPPSDQLPLPLTRKRNSIPSDQLPLPLTCWNATTAIIIPSLESYIVHNIITATIGGISVDPLGFGISTSMDSPYWQGGVDISADDFAKIESKLNKPRGQEPMINVVINDFIFSIISEEPVRTREFAKHTHNLGGRSITARLGEDYATPQSGLLDQANYASQIVGQQLNGLSVTLESYDIADWLIPANSYAVTGKTTIAVIDDVAKAAGGFLTSHPSDAKLSLKKRWKVAAWDMATATPDVIVPADVAKIISDKRRANPRYNTILLIGANDKRGIYRATQDRSLDAPVQSNDLYTDRDCFIPAGTSILSDSGIHQDYNIKMYWTEDYSIALAELGDIWQFNDTDGAWLGVVKAVAVDVERDNDAPKVSQTVTIDRYLDV